MLQQSGLTLSALRSRSRTGPFTLFITTLCLVIYIFQLTGYQDSILTLMHYPENTQQDTQFWRYLSHTFVHLSPCIFCLICYGGGCLAIQLNTILVQENYFSSS